jgi:hypothetical protein
MLSVLGLAFAAAATAVSPPVASNNAESALVAIDLRLIGSLDPSGETFVSHTGAGSFDNALALNLPYAPILNVRGQLERALGLRLDYLRAWNPAGEAHVTVVTPPEFANVLSRHLSMAEIEGVARAQNIQLADVEVLGLGSGRKLIEGRSEETFFVIVDSMKLRRIRTEVWKLFVRKGGDPADWDPTWFFPHVTIGYTLRDLHEPDVIKNLRSSYDPRFRILNR